MESANGQWEVGSGTHASRTRSTSPRRPTGHQLTIDTPKGAAARSCSHQASKCTIGTRPEAAEGDTRHPTAKRATATLRLPHGDGGTGECSMQQPRRRGLPEPGRATGRSGDAGVATPIRAHHSNPCKWLCCRRRGGNQQDPKRFMSAEQEANRINMEKSKQKAAQAVAAAQPTPNRVTGELGEDSEDEGSKHGAGPSGQSTV